VRPNRHPNFRIQTILANQPCKGGPAFVEVAKNLPARGWGAAALLSIPAG